MQISSTFDSGSPVGIGSRPVLKPGSIFPTGKNWKSSALISNYSHVHSPFFFFHAKTFRLVTGLKLTALASLRRLVRVVCFTLFALTLIADKLADASLFKTCGCALLDSKEFHEMKVSNEWFILLRKPSLKYV